MKRRACDCGILPVANPDFVLPEMPCGQFDQAVLSDRCRCGHSRLCHELAAIALLPTLVERERAFASLGIGP